MVGGSGCGREGTLGGGAGPRLECDGPDYERLSAFLAGQGPAPRQLLPGARHLLGAPIETDGSPRGLLAVGDKESRRGVGPFTASDRRTPGLFADQAATVPEHARLPFPALEKEQL